ncbi:MAG: FAD:protein FMN transferase [Desulfovibrio sp.]|nr:FAD:protein FMN transferase [Desulfovibrio sp.]
MPNTYNRRQFMRAVLLGGGMLVTGLAPVLTPVQAAASVAVCRQTMLFMGTMVSISVAHTDTARAREAMARAFALGRALERHFTRFAEGSPLGVLNASGRLEDAPPQLTSLLDRALSLHRFTHGAFDMTVLPLIRTLETARQTGKQPDMQDLRAALDLVGAEHLHMSGQTLRLHRSGMGLTLDGIAKGHVAQAMSHCLTDAGCPDHLVDAGGDMVARGSKVSGPWRVAVEDPHKKGRYPQVLDMPAQGLALATSGVYEMVYDAAGRRSHLLNPSTGQGSDLAGVSVAAPDGSMADGLATALAVMPPREALALADSLPGCSCCLMRRDGRIQTSCRWPGRGLA